MKLLVFAHKPPPHHGQSYMVKLLLEVLDPQWSKNKPPQSSGHAEELSIRCYHIDCRLSDGSEDIGRMRPGKVFRLLWYCLQAVCTRFRHGADVFLYVPAPGLRSAVYRDWMIMTLCRPFFRQRVYFWQAAGLSHWLQREARGTERFITRALLGRPDLSLVLGESVREDAVELKSRRIEIVANAVADCPDPAENLIEERRSRAMARTLPEPRNPGTRPAFAYFRVLFLSLCIREKGLFDVLEAVVLANQELEKQRSSVRIRCEVAGQFWTAAERQEFDERLRKPDLSDAQGPLITYHGFATGEKKTALFREADCFCFPSYYWAESFPLALLEALAYGLPVISTNWRCIPEILPRPQCKLVHPQSPNQVAEALVALATQPYPSGIRESYLQQFTPERFRERLKAALATLNRF